MLHTVIAALSLSQAIGYALDHSPTVAKERAAVVQARSEYLLRRAATLPNVNGSLQNTMQKSQNYSGYAIIGVPQANVYSQNTAQIGTSYTFNGGLAFWQSLAAKQTYEQSQADLHKTQQQITSDVTAAFYTLASKNDTVALDRSDVQYQAVLVKIAKAKVTAGVAAGVDVLSANAQEEKSRYTLDAAKADSENARESLAQLIGAPLDEQFDVPVQVAQPPLPPQTLDALITLALANRPEVASANDGVAIARTNRRAADADLFPQIQTFASFGNQFSPTFAGSAFAGGAQIARGTPGYWQLGVTSTFTLPLLDWGARHANHVNLNEQISEAQTNVQAAQTQVELDVRQAYRGAQTALAQMASAREESRYASEAARIARLQYEHGIKTLTDVLAAQQSSLSAQTDEFNARVAYVEAIVKLRVALGTYTPQSAVADLQGST
ncbi:MAG TPA: TolC family protein [Candidatus Baltobacteraceae bacterium]|nr:TolC family protein [Candidatus Baltobacteraceae bacterium]